MTIVIVFKNGYELRTKCESVETTRSDLTDISYQGIEENKPLYINFDEVLCVYRVVSDELTSDIKDNDGEITESEANDKQVTVTMVGNSEDTAVNLIHKVMNGKYDERNNKRDSKKTK